MFEEFLEETKYVNYSDPAVKSLAEKLRKDAEDELELIESAYYFVRDEIIHSWDARDSRVTVSAGDVLREGVGICWAKCNLFAALMRANGIPSGFSYQRLVLGDTPDTGYCIHSLSTVYIPSLERWIRLDTRGNNENITSEFSLTEEKFPFKIRFDGEYDYRCNLSAPDEGLMRVLEESTDAIYMCNHLLPDRLSYESGGGDIALQRASLDDAEKIWKMQIEAFSGLYEKYRDTETSPACEGIEKTQGRLRREDTFYYFITENGKTVGAIRIVDAKRPDVLKRISPVFIMPDARKRGIAQRAIAIAESIHGSDGWELETILQEEGNCRLYEKLGYVKTGETERVNERMTLVVYKKDAAAAEMRGNIERLHTTPLGELRITKNLGLDTDDVIGYCKDVILCGKSRIYRKGKNFYCEKDGTVITVNARSYTVITAHRKGSGR